MDLFSEIGSNKAEKGNITIHLWTVCVYVYHYHIFFGEYFFVGGSRFRGTKVHKHTFFMDKSCKLKMLTKH